VPPETVTTTTDPLERLLDQAEGAPPAVAQWLRLLRDGGEAAEGGGRQDGTTTSQDDG
jgi:hypothetical protein